MCEHRAERVVFVGRVRKRENIDIHGKFAEKEKNQNTYHAHLYTIKTSLLSFDFFHMQNRNCFVFVLGKWIFNRICFCVKLCFNNVAPISENGNFCFEIENHLFDWMINIFWVLLTVCLHIIYFCQTFPKI